MGTLRPSVKLFDIEALAAYVITTFDGRFKRSRLGKNPLNINCSRASANGWEKYFPVSTRLI